MTPTESSTKSDRRYALLILAVAMAAGVALCWTLFPEDAGVARRVVGGVVAGGLGGLIAVGNRLLE